MNNILPIFRFLKDKSAASQNTVLVTLTAVTGASTRNPGAHMAVAEDGSYAGSFSGGCVENAVVAEALDALKTGTPREVRFGAGSDYLDIRLPCGGGIDLLFCPIHEATIIDKIFALVEGRKPLTINIQSITGAISCDQNRSSARISCGGDTVHINHLPAAKIAIFGHGASVESLAHLTQSYGVEYEIYTPDPDIVSRISGHAGKATLLRTASALEHFNPDPWTACIFYFHDHDWEVQLMKQALESSAYYIGAMGSFKTHAQRKVLLKKAGVTDDDIDRMIAPIGLIPSTRDPATLALSTLSQIVEIYHHRFQR